MLELDTFWIHKIEPNPIFSSETLLERVWNVPQPPPGVNCYIDHDGFYLLVWPSHCCNASLTSPVQTGGKWIFFLKYIMRSLLVAVVVWFCRTYFYVLESLAGLQTWSQEKTAPKPEISGDLCGGLAQNPCWVCKPGFVLVSLPQSLDVKTKNDRSLHSF